MTRIYIEGTPVSQQYFDSVVPLMVHDGGDGLTPDMVTRYPIGDRMHDDDPTPYDPFEDDTPIVASCDLSSPESCESCS